MVTNTIKGFLQTFPMEPQTVLQQIALSFDVSWWQSLLGLATGGTVVVAGKDIRRDPFALTALIASHTITLTLAVPSEATSWLEHGDFLQLRQSAWEWHISAGEEIGNNLIEKIRRLEKLDLRLLNAYGPAETIIPNAHEILYRDRNLDISSIPIGKAMPNYSVYIIDQDYHPLPAGVPGQIVIGGAGVASGYINQPNLTATRFPKDALANARAVANGWIQAHLSGDRGYMREDGVFVALGRINGDTQVKLRGQRFELREVEVAMVTAGKGDILEAVCHIRSHNEKDAASAFLVAHVTLAQEVQNKYGTNGPVIDSILRNVVSGLVLPQYMRPSFVVALPSMPLNHHGKVDRKFLSTSPLKKTAEALKPSPRFVQGRSAQFQNEMEEIWRDALGDLVDNQKLEEGSDFFLIGGNSLLLIKVQSKIKERTRHDIPLVKLFEASTLGKMAAMLHDSQQDNDKEQPLRTSSEGKMKQIWLSVLSDLATEDIITSDADFFLIGGNSLLLIRVQNEVHKQFGVLFPLASLFEASKLGQMATLLDKLVTENDESRRSELDINWKDEVACHDQFPAVTSVASNHELTGGSPSGTIVVLTGATGFLGRHILQRLVSDDTVKEVHCIAIRDISKPLVGSPKVSTYPGDLRDPLLGLSDDTARRVFSRASAIIHNGADVSFLRSYWTLRAANVLSTKALVRLAMKHAIDKSLLHFHFVSTAGVVQLGTDELYEEAISASQPQKNANGYIVSKWASEKYLENVHAGSGLSVTIHRPTYVLGPDAPQLDVMHNILRFAERLRSVPHMPSVDRWLQFVGIDDVAQDIVTEVLDIRDGQGVNLQYRNHCGVESNWVRLDQLALFLERQHGAKFSKVDFADWIESAGRAGMPVQVKEYLTNLMVSSETNNHVWTSPRVLKGPRNIIAPWRKKGRL